MMWIKGKYIPVVWGNLKSADDSVYRKDCPFCEAGIFLVGRNIHTLHLEEFDNCISCGQRVKYLDIEKMRNMDCGKGYNG